MTGEELAGILYNVNRTHGATWEKQTDRRHRQRYIALAEAALAALARERDAHVAALEKALAAKIGPDWREALPYESELELVSVIKAKNALVGRLEKVVEAAREILRARSGFYESPRKPETDTRYFAACDALFVLVADLDATR